MAPPATAVLLVRRVPLIMVVAVAVGSASVIVGLLISFHEGSAAGATMALTAVVIFLVVLAAQALRRSLARPAAL